MNSRFFYDDALSDYRRNEIQEMLVAPPVDLSFKKAVTMDELASKRAHTIRTGKAPLRTAKGHFVTSSLWLSSNSLTSMDGFESLATEILDNPRYLSWLDLSFNKFDEIGDEITKFTNLKILYLHGNNISDINNVAKLKNLRKLRSLTLHGNPVENIPYYRGYVINILPEISTLDFSAVLAADKKRPVPVGFFKIRSIT